MTTAQTQAFQQLLSAWRQREEARSVDTIGDLSDARVSLENARANMQSTLHAIR